MARSMVITFPSSSATNLYPTSVAGGGAGTISLSSQFSITRDVSYPIIFPHFAIPVTFTSTDDLSAINFTISGTDLFGNKISEVIAGPNNTTVTSVKTYNTITSISASGNYTNFSIGTGSTGITQWIPMNTNSTSPTDITIQAIVQGTIEYSMNQTLDSLEYYLPVGPYYSFEFPEYVALANNPVTTVNGSHVVELTVPSTGGLQTGDVVSVVNATTTNSITAQQINVTNVITVVDATHFSYISSGTGGAGGLTGGGANVGYYFPALPISNPIAAALTDATTDQVYNLTQPVNAIQLQVVSSTAPGTLTLTLTQQGLV